jgi:ABC-type Na+ efflux pump permease subunit
MKTAPTVVIDEKKFVLRGQPWSFSLGPVKLYTETQVAVASGVGSPLAGGILMAHNASAVGDKRDARHYLFITAAATALLLVIGFLLPPVKPGNYLGPIIVAWLMRCWFRKAQGSIIAAHPEAARGSWWVSLGIALLVTACLLVLLIGAFTLLDLVDTEG